MSKQWQATTRGGLQYRITTRDPDSDFPIRGEVEDSGFVAYVQWTEDGRCNLDGESPCDLIPIEPEAPSPAKVRVDLALAAMRHKAHCDALKLAEDIVDESKRLLFNTFVAAQKTDVVVKIDGEHYHFWINEITPRFRKIEVL
jgi:hypothetical protein